MVMQILTASLNNHDDHDHDRDRDHENHGDHESIK
eukprot:g6161.t1